MYLSVSPTGTESEKMCLTRDCESAEVNESDHEYEVGHNKRYEPETSKGGVGKKRHLSFPDEMTLFDCSNVDDV